MTYAQITQSDVMVAEPVELLQWPLVAHAVCLSICGYIIPHCQCVALFICAYQARLDLFKPIIAFKASSNHALALSLPSALMDAALGLPHVSLRGWALIIAHHTANLLAARCSSTAIKGIKVGSVLTAVRCCSGVR